MDESQIYSSLQEVFDDVFVSEVVVGPQLSAKDVDEWDSLSHVSLVMAIEERFAIRFRVGEVEATKNVGELVTVISSRIGAK